MKRHAARFKDMFRRLVRIRVKIKIKMIHSISSVGQEGSKKTTCNKRAN